MLDGMRLRTAKKSDCELTLAGSICGRDAPKGILFNVAILQSVHDVRSREEFWVQVQQLLGEKDDSVCK